MLSQLVMTHLQDAITFLVKNPPCQACSPASAARVTVRTFGDEVPLQPSPNRRRAVPTFGTDEVSSLPYQPRYVHRSVGCQFSNVTPCFLLLVLRAVSSASVTMSWNDVHAASAGVTF